MKKTNFIVVFWLVIAIISFLGFVFKFGSVWSDISYLIFPDENYYDSQINLKRGLVQNIPLVILYIVTFIFSLKLGLKEYNKKA